MIKGTDFARAVPVIYRKSGKVAVFTLGPQDVKIPIGTQIGEVHPLKLTQKEVVKSVHDINDEEDNLK